MGVVSSIFATIQEASGSSLPAQTDAAFGPQANAPPTVAAHQDIVTLAGSAAEGQQTRANNDSGQFGESAAFFFAEKQSFRAGSGSGGSKTAQTPNVPELPVKIVGEPAPGQNAQAARAEADAANERNRPALDTEADSSGVRQATSLPEPAQGGDTPLAELAQLDDTLQQMGINPQSISLFSRMAMVLYANDPAALRVLVQTLQSGTQQRSEAGSVDGANGMIANGPDLLAASTAPLLQPAQSFVATNAGILASNRADEVVERLPSPPTRSQTDQTATEKAIGSATTPFSPKTNRNIGSDLQEQRPHFSIQLEELNSTFAAIDAPQASWAARPAGGQLLNVTF